MIPQQGHPEFSINPVFFATCAPLFINATVVIVYRYYRSFSFSYLFDTFITFHFQCRSLYLFAEVQEVSCTSTFPI